jgi:hypothetical protein
MTQKILNEIKDLGVMKEENRRKLWTLIVEAGDYLRG